VQRLRQKPGASAQEGHQLRAFSVTKSVLRTLEPMGGKPGVFHQLLPGISSLEPSLFAVAQLQNPSENLPTKPLNPAI